MKTSSEVDFSLIKKKAVKGVAALTGRMFVLQGVAFLGFFALTILLGKEEIGLFFAISELVAILGYFSDVGLAAALIQKKEKPSIKDIRSTFTIQQGLVLSLLALVFVLTPFLKSFYNIPDSGVFLLYSLTIGFFLASLKTVPSVLLERKLRFDLLVVVEIAESLLFYGLAVLLAWKGFGVSSYAWAVLARGAAGVILIYTLSPWRVGFAFEKKSLKDLLKFGIPYQANSFLAVVKDRLMNVFLWKIIGTTGVGILGWAQKWAQMPLRFVMDAVIKVTFPAYSRMQDHKEELSKAVDKTFFFISLLVFPLVLGMMVLARPLMSLIPQYQKWEVALLALYLFGFNSLWAAVTTPLTNALSAIGRIKIVFKLMIMWTSLTWILYPALAYKFGYNGAAFAACLVSLSSIAAIVIAKKYLHFNLLKSIKAPLISSALMAGLCFGLVSVIGKNIFGVAGVIVLSGLFYFGLIYLFKGDEFLNDSKKLVDLFRKKA
ncbi:MAG: oligosaccharide flippase family protein [Patescibacteria group bacterium]